MDLDRLQALALGELRKHNLAGWTFGFADTKRRLGVCKYRQKRIEISAYYALHTPDAAVLDTLLHEIAHAIAGPAARHGPAWKAVAIRLGATPKACDDSPETVVKPGDWQTTCPACQRTHHRYRRPRSLTGYRCKCRARSPLVYEYRGDPARRPTIPDPRESARWEATCVGCGTVHHRHRRPKAGLWRCRCPHRSELRWRHRHPPTAGAEQTRQE